MKGTLFFESKPRWVLQVIILEVKMKQNEIARQYAVQELEHMYGWRSSDAKNIMNLFREDEKEDDEYAALERVVMYPHHILGGWTWGRFMADILLKETIVRQISAFYGQSYPKFKEKLLHGEYESDKPIWIVIRAKELEQDTVYPLITNYAEHNNCIVLAINEI